MDTLFGQSLRASPSSSSLPMPTSNICSISLGDLPVVSFIYLQMQANTRNSSPKQIMHIHPKPMEVMSISVDMAAKMVNTQMAAIIRFCSLRISLMYIQMMGPSDRLNPTMWMKIITMNRGSRSVGARAIVSNVHSIISWPESMNVRLPHLSRKSPLISVVAVCARPRPRQQQFARDQSLPVMCRKICLAQNRIAFIPENWPAIPTINANLKRLQYPLVLLPDLIAFFQKRVRTSVLASIFLQTISQYFWIQCCSLSQQCRSRLSNLNLTQSYGTQNMRLAALSIQAKAGRNKTHLHCSPSYPFPPMVNPMVQATAMPIVINSWLRLPVMPAIEGGDSDTKQAGITDEFIPMIAPMNSLEKTRMKMLRSSIWRLMKMREPTSNRISRRRGPIMSVKRLTMRQPSNAPNGSEAVTMPIQRPTMSGLRWLYYTISGCRLPMLIISQPNRNDPNTQFIDRQYTQALDFTQFISFIQIIYAQQCLRFD